jgi:hypothetical protein
MLEERKSFEDLMAMPAVDEDGEEDTTAGLTSLGGLEARLRKLDLAQIGYLFLTAIGEANHNSWDSVPREELIGINNLFWDLSYELDKFHPAPGPVLSEFCFGSEEWWDEQGKRHPGRKS